MNFFFLTLSFAQCIVELLLGFQQEIVRFVYNLQVADISRVENITCGLVLQAKALAFFNLDYKSVILDRTIIYAANAKGRIKHTYLVLPSGGLFDQCLRR